MFWSFWESSNQGTVRAVFNLPLFTEKRNFISERCIHLHTAVVHEVLFFPQLAVLLLILLYDFGNVSYDFTFWTILLDSGTAEST